MEGIDKSGLNIARREADVQGPKQVLKASSTPEQSYPTHRRWLLWWLSYQVIRVGRRLECFARPSVSEGIFQARTTTGGLERDQGPDEEEVKMDWGVVQVR